MFEGGLCGRSLNTSMPETKLNRSVRQFNCQNRRFTRVNWQAKLYDRATDRQQIGAKCKQAQQAAEPNISKSSTNLCLNQT